MEHARVTQRLVVIVMLIAGLYTLSVYCEPMRPLLLAEGDDPISVLPDFQEGFSFVQKNLPAHESKQTIQYHTDADVQIDTTPGHDGSCISQVNVHTSSQLATNGVITDKHETQQTYEVLEQAPTEALQEDAQSVLNGSPLLTRGTSMMVAARKTKLIAQNKKKLQQQLAFLPEYLQEAVRTTAYGVDGVPYQEQVRQCRALLAENDQLTRQYQSHTVLNTVGDTDADYQKMYRVILQQLQHVVEKLEALIAQKNTQLKGYRHLLDVLIAKKEQASKNKKSYASYTFSELTALAQAVRAVQKEMAEQNTYAVRDEALYKKCAEFEYDALQFIKKRTKDIATVADTELTRQEAMFQEKDQIRFAFLHELLQPDQPYFKERQTFIDQAFEYQTGRESFDKEGKKFFAFIKSLEATAVKLSEMRLEAFPAFLQKKVTECIAAYKNKELSKTTTYAQIKALLAAAGTRDEWVEVIKKDVKENAPVVYKHCFPEPGWFGSLGRRKTYTRSGSGDSESSV